MLFLKRCSDVFDAEREKIVGTRIEQGMAKEKAEGYGEDPDYYDGFFVPERARWAYLQDKLGDAKEPYGSVLDKALGALAEHNDTLEHVLDHISFMRSAEQQADRFRRRVQRSRPTFQQIPAAKRRFSIFRPARVRL